MAVDPGECGSMDDHFLVSFDNSRCSHKQLDILCLVSFNPELVRYIYTDMWVTARKTQWHVALGAKIVVF